MEQLKHYLRLLRRNQFWALSGLIVLVGLSTWFLTVHSLATEQQDRKTSIETSYSAVDNVMKTQNHQNREVQEKMADLIARRRQQVQQAWQEKFNQQSGGQFNQQSGGQSEEDILKWPEELGAEFIQHVQKLRPIEQAIPDPWPLPDDKIPLYMREDYRNYVKEELPKLAEKIGSVWAPDLDDRAAFNRPTGESEPRFAESPADRDSATLVSWNPEDQQRIQSAHFDWSSGYRTPSSVQVLYAQEDLWVLTALMEIIGKTNGNATVRHNANIKQIEFIQIGRSTTVGQRGQIRRVVAPGAPSEVRSEEGSESPPEEEAIPDREEGGADEGAERRIEVDPADLRYVDKFYNSLPAATLRAAASSDRPEDAYLRVAKRMPIRMRVRMDQRAINRFLVECANFNLTVEVRQIRVNPQDSAMGRGGSGMSYLQEGGETGGGDFGQPIEQRREGFSLEGPPRFGPLGGLEIAFPYDVIVEIYGIIYVYNPVDETILRGEEEAGGAGRSLASAGG